MWNLFSVVREDYKGITLRIRNGLSSRKEVSKQLRSEPGPNLYITTSSYETGMIHECE